MKGDFSRTTFRPAEHYAAVLQQQGRVQLDADWNEQIDIQAHRDETVASDVVGRTGAPLDDAGFAFSCDGGDISASGCPAAKVHIGAGRYYVDGILCENEAPVSVQGQPDQPGAGLPGQEGTYVAYLDVWRRHVTVLEDDEIREVALGGPDTATRTKTVWQVKLEPTSAPSCAALGTGWAPAGSESTGRLAAKAEEAQQNSDECLVPAGAGFRGLENQLYRVEIHDGGTALAFPRPPGTAVDTATIVDATHVRVTSLAVGGTGWKPGQVVEVFSDQTDAANGPGTVARVTEVDAGTLTLTVDSPLTALQGNSGLKARRVASFVWSRDNGSVVARLQGIDPVTSIITVSHPNRDAVSGFAGGDWVEITDEAGVLGGGPGPMVPVSSVKGNELTASSFPGGAPPAVGTRPTVRRWDSNGPQVVTAGPFVELERGVLVAFAPGTYRSGDYWTVAARTLTHQVEWPADPTDATKPAFLPASGIEHHYAPLALLRRAAVDTWTLVSDCRRLFPPLTELTSFSYVGGDGQEALPDLTASPPVVPPLPSPLEVSVTLGSRPVKNAPVLFKVTAGNGKVNGAAQAPVATDAAGVARVQWTPDPGTRPQRVEAVLLDDGGNGLAVPPIHFTATVSRADQVAFDPKKCVPLAGTKTVQDAIERMQSFRSLERVAGDGQDAMPGVPVPQALQVRVVDGCGPVGRAKVRFQPSDNGQVAADATGFPGAASLDASSDPATGLASCAWLPDSGGPPVQQLAATLLDGAGNPLPLTAVTFTANLSTASQVHYDPCDQLAGADTVQQALDKLCELTGGGAEPGVTLRGISLSTTGQALQLDQVVAPGDLKDGIILTPSEPIDLIVTKIVAPVIRLVVDLPFPLNPADAGIWGSTVVGTTPVTLNGRIGSVLLGRRLSWTPTDQAAAWLDQLSGTVGRLVVPRVGVRLIVDGNYIWSRADPNRFLDADGFGVTQDGAVVLRFPTGDGRRGGVLRLPFWLAIG
ncbi:MAG: DUF6519 domain-containing protein [Actinomycetota bacterium]|nr:DUF6519 domain-containing protein [Actinomycetota bacterium]